MKSELMSKKELVEFYTRYWCKTKGIFERDLVQHPQINDITILVNIRDTYWSDMTASHRGVWAAYWDWVYFKKKPLKAKHLKKLEHIVINAENTKKFKTLRLTEQRQKIWAMRKTTAERQIQKPADNMTAKDAGPLQSVPWD